MSCPNLLQKGIESNHPSDLLLSSLIPEREKNLVCFTPIRTAHIRDIEKNPSTPGSAIKRYRSPEERFGQHSKCYAWTGSDATLADFDFSHTLENARKRAI